MFRNSIKKRVLKQFANTRANHMRWHVVQNCYLGIRADNPGIGIPGSRDCVNPESRDWKLRDFGIPIFCHTEIIAQETSLMPLGNKQRNSQRLKEYVCVQNPFLCRANFRKSRLYPATMCFTWHRFTPTIRDHLSLPRPHALGSTRDIAPGLTMHTIEFETI